MDFFFLQLVHSRKKKKSRSLFLRLVFIRKHLPSSILPLAPTIILGSYAHQHSWFITKTIRGI